MLCGDSTIKQKSGIMRKKKKKTPDRLPPEFKRYFWDVEFKRLSLKKHTNFVLSRVMNYGDQRVLKWLFQLPKEMILKVVRTSRELDNKTRNYWTFIYERKSVS